MSALIAANCSGIKASRQPTPLLEWMKGPGPARLARYGHVEEMIVNVKMSVMAMSTAKVYGSAGAPKAGEIVYAYSTSRRTLGICDRAHRARPLLRGWICPPQTEACGSKGEFAQRTLCRRAYSGKRLVERRR